MLMRAENQVGLPRRLTDYLQLTYQESTKVLLRLSNQIAAPFL